MKKNKGYQQRNTTDQNRSSPNFESSNKSIVLFDGFCNLCSWAVRFILKRDVKDIFRFASLQSKTGKQYLSEYNISEDFDKSVILISNNSIYLKSEAALRIAKNLRGLWFLLYYLIVIPKPIRDYIYTIISKYRYKWFGKRTSCFFADKNYRYKFL